MDYSRLSKACTCAKLQAVTLLFVRGISFLSFSKVALSLLSQQIAEYLQQEVQVPPKLRSGHLEA